MYNRTDLVLTIVPNSVEAWSPFFKQFTMLMMEKLDKNSHKGNPAIKDLAGLMTLLKAEIKEFEDQIALDRFDRNATLELADIANYAFIAYVAIKLEENK